MKKLEQVTQELEKWRGVAHAMYRFIQKAHPTDFNLYGFILAGTMGNTELMVKQLDEYVAKRTEADRLAMAEDRKDVYA